MAKSLLQSLHETDAKFLLLKNSRSRERMSQAISDNLGTFFTTKEPLSESSTKPNSKTIASLLECRKKSAKGIYEIYSQCLKHSGADPRKPSYHRIAYGFFYLCREEQCVKKKKWKRRTRGSYESFTSKRSMLHSYKHSFSIQEGVRFFARIKKIVGNE